MRQNSGLCGAISHSNPRLRPSLLVLASIATITLTTTAGADTSLLPNWSSLVNSNGTVNTPQAGVVAVIRDTVANNGAVDATKRTTTGNIAGRVGRLNDVGNTYFFADTSGNERVIYTATERRSDTTNPKKTSVIITLKRDKNKTNKGDVRAKIKFNSREEANVFVVKRYSGSSWEPVHVSRFNGAACAGNESLAMACLTDTSGSIVDAPVSTDSGDDQSTSLAPDQMIQMRLKLSSFPATSRCSVLTVKTAKDIARGTVDCKPNARGNRLRTLGDTSALERAIKDGLIAQLNRPQYYPVAIDGEPEVSEAFADGGAGGGGGGASSFTTTNLQEAGVDEYDYVKTDGNVVYILRSGNNSEDNPIASSLPGPGVSYEAFTNLRVVDINPGNGTASALTEIPLESVGTNRESGMYLYPEGNKLAVVSTLGNFDHWGFWHEPYGWSGRSSNISLVDVSSPASPEEQSSIDLDGEVISSRRIGQTLYVATRFSPKLSSIDFYVQEGTPEYDRAVDKIESLSLDKLLPHYSRNRATKALLTEPEKCFVAKQGASEPRADVVSVTAINLDSATVADSVCFVGPTETMYMSPASLYLATTRYSYETQVGGDEVSFIYQEPEITTDIHKFSLNDGAIAYRASGTVPGHLGWNPDRKPWRMSESGSHLRVVTMSERFATRGSPVTLSILNDTGSGRLDTTATLPNSARPENIGKPGEQLYASRFVGDRGYFVTFRATDPLYVVDLSNPGDPRVTGELEIEGYSDYLHPVNERLMVGLGKDAIPDDSGDFRGAWVQGVKLALFDVSDPTDPREIDTISIGKRGSDSAALSTHKAFTFMPATNGNPPRLALDMQLNDTASSYQSGHPSDWYDWTSSGAYLFEVDDGATPALRHTGTMMTRFPDPASYGFYGDQDRNERTIIADDSLYYISRFEVFGASWNSPGNFNGPH